MSQTTTTFTATGTATTTSTSTATVTATGTTITMTETATQAANATDNATDNGSMTSVTTTASVTATASVTTTTLTGTDTMTITGTWTGTETGTETETGIGTNTTTTLTLTLTTTGEPKAMVTGTLELSLDETLIDAFIADPLARLGVEQGIALIVGVPSRWVQAILTRIAGRRLQMIPASRRLEASGNVLVTYTIRIPETAAASFTGASISNAIADATISAISNAISDKVAETTQTYAVQVTAVATPVVTMFGPTTTTRGKKPNMSLTRPLTAFTAAHAMAILLGMISMRC
eukprot:CAMPEP_0180466908 /NCGR_PEP_ID=MMETSP1036_2-20121128/26719_1 /TAXON_ID=632150 /ORGANISM="Azadinium spinosum, Strain 3D9" /LENGTH=290 /DNA_ID=CAMNT_0022473839 /DNA_START=194 /DNA_END=1066 /DNA_ORIENTATION=-